MKKCPECSREIDKHAIACQYCGRVEEERASKSKEKTVEETNTESE